MKSKGASALVAALAVTCASAAEAAPRKKIADVCEGCLATVPDDDAPAPLLVTLHGDWGHLAPDLHRAWERFAGPRDIALLSLACPSKLGCKNSWWQWNGGPSWIVEQVDRLAAARAIDRERMWIAGWSGGATYIGMRTQEIERTFAGIVIHGGGYWPSAAGCAAEKARVVFLVGDRNPLHKNGLVLRDHYTRCGNDLTFNLLPGAEHDGEWNALGAHGGAILHVLATARRTRPAVVATAASSAPSATASASAATASSPTSQVPAVPAQPRAGCGCDVGARTPGSFALILPVLLLVARRRSQSPSIVASEDASASSLASASPASVLASLPHA